MYPLQNFPENDQHKEKIRFYAYAYACRAKSEGYL